MSGRSNRRRGDRGPREERSAEEVAHEAKPLWREGESVAECDELARTGGSTRRKRKRRLRPHQEARKRHTRKDRNRKRKAPSGLAQRGIQLFPQTTVTNHCGSRQAPRLYNIYKQVPLAQQLSRETLHRLETEHRKAQALLQRELARTQRWTMLAAGALATQVHDSSEEAAHLRSIKTQIFKRDATKASINRLQDISSNDDGTIFDARSHQRREIESMRPAAINAMYRDYARFHPQAWSDTRPGGGRDGLMQDAANREQADMTARSQLLRQAVPLESQGPAALTGTRPLTSTGVAEMTTRLGQQLGKLRSAEVCAGACSTTAVAEERSGFFEPVLLCERDVQARGYLKKAHPKARIVTEAWELTIALLQELGVQVLHASTSCTSFSPAGNQRGLKEADANVLFHVLHLAKNMDDGKGAVMFSFENVREIVNHVHKDDFKGFIERMLPNHHVSVGHVQAAATVNPYDQEGAALVSHMRLWIFAVRKDKFADILEVDSLPRCEPAGNAEHVMEKDCERSGAYNVMPQHDQHFLLPVERPMYARPTPGMKAPFYYVTHRIADAPEKTIGTGVFPSKVVDLRRGLCPTLTSHSWPWVVDTLHGKTVMRQLTHVEAQRCYGLTMSWQEQPPALDNVFWRRQISQCVPQTVANARTHAFFQALTTVDSEGETPLNRIKRGENLKGKPPAHVAASVNALFENPAQDLLPHVPAQSPGWSPKLDQFDLQNMTHRGRHICARYQHGKCQDPSCAHAHVCHICLVAHPKECPDAARWREARDLESEEDREARVLDQVQRVNRVCLPQGICDPDLLRHAQAVVQQLNCVGTNAGGLAAAVQKRWPHAVPYQQRAPQARMHGYAKPEHWDMPGTVQIHSARRNDEPTIINLFAQFDLGKPGRKRAIPFPSGIYDTSRQREDWFWRGLLRITQWKDRPESLAFPHEIGCQFAGGTWKRYEAMIERFADLNPDIKVTIVEHGNDRWRDDTLQVNSTTLNDGEGVEPGYEPEWWKHEPDSAIWWECSHGAAQVRGKPADTPRGYYMDHEHTQPMPACRRPACVRYGRREYAKMRPILSEPYWPEEEEDDQPQSTGAAEKAAQSNGARVASATLLSDDDIVCKQLTRGNLQAIAADPFGARCVHCFAATSIATDSMMAQGTTALCPECARSTLVPVSQVPGNLLQTLRRWRKRGLTQMPTALDHAESTSRHAHGTDVKSDEGEKDQAQVAENSFFSAEARQQRLDTETPPARMNDGTLDGAQTAAKGNRDGQTADEGDEGPGDEMVEATVAQAASNTDQRQRLSDECRKLHEKSLSQQFQCELVADVTPWRCESLPREARTVARARLRNSGSNPWPADTCLRWLCGSRPQRRIRRLLGPVQPGECVEVDIPVSVPRVGNLHSTAYHISARSAPNGQRLLAEMRVQVEVTPAKKIAMRKPYERVRIRMASDWAPLHQRIVEACGLAQDEEEEELEDWEMLAEDEHRCDHCTYHPPLHEATQNRLREVQLCADIERTGCPTIDILDAHQDSQSLQAFTIDRYAVYDLQEGHLWVPVPQGDEPTGPSRLPQNQWASQRIGKTVYGPALLVRREDLDRLRKLEARHDDMHLATVEQGKRLGKKLVPRMVWLRRKPLRTRMQELRLKTRAPDHDETCTRCREARNLSLGDYHSLKSWGAIPAPTHSHCHVCGMISRTSEATCPACDTAAAQQRKEVWTGAASLSPDCDMPGHQATEEGLENKQTEYREDIMILPCALMTDEQGQLVPHVAIHQNGDSFHPIGGKVADEPWLRQESLADAIKRELLEEAMDDEALASQLASWTRLSSPSLAWYASPRGETVKGSLWSVVTDLPLSVRRKEPDKHEHTSYVPIQEVFSDEQRWARPSLFRAARNEVHRALERCREGQAEASWREALAPAMAMKEGEETTEGVLLQVADNALQASVLVAQIHDAQGRHLCCPVNADLRSTEAAARFNRKATRLQDLGKHVDLDARLMAEDAKCHVWGGLLTAEAADEVRQWTADGKGYRVRAIPLLDFLCGDMDWRAQWRSPLQLLRMQLTALDVYFAALQKKSLPAPPKAQQIIFLRRKEQLEDWRSRHCWAFEEAMENQVASQGLKWEAPRRPMFSWHSRYPLAQAKTRRKVTLPKGESMVTLIFEDLFGGLYETPPAETGREVYTISTHPHALALGALAIHGAVVAAGRTQQEICIRNNGPSPLTIPANTPLGAITEKAEAEEDPTTNYLINGYTTQLMAQHQLDLTKHTMEDELHGTDLQEPVRRALLHGAQSLPGCQAMKDLVKEGADAAQLAQALMEQRCDTPGSNWDELTRLVMRSAPAIARGDNRAARRVAVQLHVHEEEKHGVPLPVLRHEATCYYAHATLSTPSWKGRHVAWGHVYQEPETPAQVAKLKSELASLVERAQREQPASLVILTQAGWKGNAALRDMRRQGFQEIGLTKQAHAYFETDRHIGRKRFKRLQDAQADLRVMWYQPPSQDDQVHAAIAEQDQEWSEENTAAFRRRVRTLVEADDTLKPPEHEEVISRILVAMRQLPATGQGRNVEAEEIRRLVLQAKDNLEREQEDAELLEMAKKSLADDGLMTEPQKEQMLGVLRPYLRHTLNPKNLGRTSMFGKFTIDTGDARPVRTIPWRVSPMEKEIIREEVRKMMKLKVVEESNSPWATQVVLVKKKDGTHRMAIDYRGLNAVTRFDASPLPRVDETIAVLQGKRYFSLADLNSGFWQLELDEESKAKTAFQTSDGLYHFCTMPMGLSCASQSWQRLMNHLIHGHLHEFCCSYIDDLIIFSDTFEDHLEHVDKTLRRFAEAGLTLKLRKCLWAAGEVHFLGHIVQGDSIRPDPEKTAAIRAFRKPRNIHQLRAFLGLCNWYRRFIGNFALITAPLVALTKKENQGLIGMRMDDKDCVQAFEALKDALCHPDLMLLQPDHNKDFRVETDACDYQLGAVLTQQDGEGNWRPVEYWSRRLTTAEYNQRQTPTYLEAIAIFEATTRWRHFLISRPFAVVSDHQALVSLPTRKSATDRLTRIQLSLQDFNYKVLYRQGEDNVVPDALSRIHTEDTGEGPDPADVHQVFPERTLTESYKRWQGYELLDPKLRPLQAQPEHVLEMTVDTARGKHAPAPTDHPPRAPAAAAATLSVGQASVHNAPLTRSVASRLQAVAEDEPSEPSEWPTPEDAAGRRYVGRHIRKRFGAVWYIGKVVQYVPGEEFEDRLPGFKIVYPADGDTEELNEEELNAVLLDADPSKWPNPLLVGAGEGSSPSTAEPARWSWPREVTEAREEAERRLITPCRILPGYEPLAGPEDHRYLCLPDDTELLKAQKEDAWCTEVMTLLSRLQKEGLSSDETTAIHKDLVKHDIPKTEVPQWFLEPSTGLLMREGFMRNRPRRKGLVKAKGGQGPSLEETRAAGKEETKRIVPQRVIPVALRSEMLYAHHGHVTAGHKGVNRVREAMARTVWWPKISSDIKRHIQGCRCPKGYRELRQERPKLTKSLLQETQGFGQHICIDCSGIGPETRHGNRVFMVIVDTFSLYTCVVPLPAATAKEVARALIQQWISYFGVPMTLHSDGGPEFHNNLLGNIARQLQVNTTRISPYNPSGNTLAENAVKKTKQQITELVGDYYDTWDEYACLATWTYNASMNERTGAIPMAVAFGQLPRGIVDLALPPLRPERDREGRPREEWSDYRTSIMDVLQKSNEWVHRQNQLAVNEKAGAEHDLKKGYEVRVGDSVWLYNPVLKVKRHRQYHNCWAGPYLVHAVSHTQHTATLQIEGGRRLKSVNVRQLRKYQSPLLATYGGDPRTLAALPTKVLAYREQREEGTPRHQYLVRLHTDTSFQDWIDADLLPRSMILDFWRLSDSNPYLRDFEPPRSVVVMMPDRGTKLHEGTIQGRRHNLLQVLTEGGDCVQAYVTPTGTIRSAESTTEEEGRARDAHARPREADSESIAVPVDPAATEELRGESSPAEGGLADVTARVLRSGRSLVQADTTHMQPRRQTTSSIVGRWEPLARRYPSQKGLGPNAPLGYLATAGSTKAAPLAAWRPLAGNSRHEERHPRMIKRVPKHWHPPWDAIIEEEESSRQPTTRVFAAQAL